jgi:hypothetical protein
MFTEMPIGICEGKSMSTTKASAAARELAMRLFASDHGMGHMNKLPDFESLRNRHQAVIEKYERLIDSHLEPLLRTGETLLCVFGGNAPSHGCACNNCDHANEMVKWNAGR